MHEPPSGGFFLILLLYSSVMHARSFGGRRFSAVVVSRHQREGFYPLRVYEAGYPKADGWDEPDAVAFLAHLDLVEARVHHSGKLYHRDRTFCRLCGQPASVRELVYRGWSWSDCLRHYIEMHRLRPGDAFVEFIEAEAAELRAHWRDAPVPGPAPGAAAASAGEG
ncbi:hypothetical protein RAMLITH_02580 [Ramlibacter sp. RBP-2]|uniref:Uncharacterized protein n=1 Tax=Ramlibacter lithotrophicus TaxID=2606681 RepID=A0A7X6DCP0_9BURK|nr:hypothetical protein [Ramlibacter lithotrophicus]NKE64696.1 hypothetical protein [Ramlibacter lithotrophicus]